MLERIAQPLSGLTHWIAGVVDATYRVLGRPGKLLQDFLNGSWMGHALHPVIVDVVVGGSTAAVLLLALSWFGVQGLYVPMAWILALACLAALAAIVTGLTDFKDTFGDEMDVAGLHGVTNIIGTAGLVVAFFGALLEAPVLLGVFLVGSYGVLSVGAFIGGHVVFKFGSMVNRNAFSGGKRAKEFTAVAAASEVADGTPTKVMLGATALVVVRRGDVAYALKDTCSHAGTSLATGRLEGDTIICPTHGSAFRLADGAVRHGPATTRQVSYEARVNGDQVEVRGPNA